jgi:segregation and condensation protein B
MTDPRDIEAVLEAILFVANEPVTRKRLLEVFDENENEAVGIALEALVERYREHPERGVMVDEVAGGLRLVSRPDLHGYLRRFFEVSGSNKLTMAALETLAIIAYRQPITGPEIQELRSVNSSGVIKKLLERRLIRIAGRKEVVGKPFLYTTTRDFLMHFGLRNLKELPPLEQFEELFGGEVESASEEEEPDLEEQIDHEVAALDEALSDAADAAELESIEEERATAEALAEEVEIVGIVTQAATTLAPEDTPDVGNPEGPHEEDYPSEEGTSAEGEGASEADPAPADEDEGRPDPNETLKSAEEEEGT